MMKCLFQILIEFHYYYIYYLIYTHHQILWMDIKPNQHIAVLLHIANSQNQAEIKSQLIKDLKQQATIVQEDIFLQNKDGKFSAYIRLPSQAAIKLCAKKEMQLSSGDKVNIKRYYADFQIFINKLNENISKEDVENHFEKFGNISCVQITDAHAIQHTTKVANRHCYIRFENEQDAEKCLMSGNQQIKGQGNLRVLRNYKIGESEQSDRKLFVKVVPNVSDIIGFEQIVNAKFSELGKLRERIRVQGKQNTKFNVTYLNQQSYQRALNKLNNSKIGEHTLTLRQFISPLKEANRIFVPGLKANISQTQVEKAFSVFGKILQKAILPTRKPDTFNVVITYQNQQSMKRAIVQARENKDICQLFYRQPYVTIHMSPKQRKQYESFNKKSDSDRIPNNKYPSNWNSQFTAYNNMNLMGMNPIGINTMGMNPMSNPLMRPNQPPLNFNQPPLNFNHPISGITPGMPNKMGNFQMKPNTQN